MQLLSDVSSGENSNEEQEDKNLKKQKLLVSKLEFLSENSWFNNVSFCILDEGWVEAARGWHPQKPSSNNEVAKCEKKNKKFLNPVLPSRRLLAPVSLRLNFSCKQPSKRSNSKRECASMPAIDVYRKLKLLACSKSTRLSSYNLKEDKCQASLVRPTPSDIPYVGKAELFRKYNVTAYCKPVREATYSSFSLHDEETKPMLCNTISIAPVLSADVLQNCKMATYRVPPFQYALRSASKKESKLNCKQVINQTALHYRTIFRYPSQTSNKNKNTRKERWIKLISKLPKLHQQLKADTEAIRNLPVKGSRKDSSNTRSITPKLRRNAGSSVMTPSFKGPPKLPQDYKDFADKYLFESVPHRFRLTKRE